MEVKTGVLKNQLSRYLRHVRETGETVTVLDRDTPVAELRPVREQQGPRRPSVWDMRQRDEEVNGRWTEDFELPKRRTAKRKQKNPLD
ncbi:MAG: type II toxin-antitoxin system Phd/YefM family antitoxin [Puniceicoccales bacterium]